MSENIFVLGLDEHNHETLNALPHFTDYRFHPLLDLEKLQNSEDIDIPALLAQAQERLDSFDGSIDAIIGYWDFPVSSMVPILCQRYGLPASPLEAVVKCEHKYWSRLEQREVITEIPGFAEIEPGTKGKPNDLDYPLWLKPVKAFSSELAFRVTNDTEFREALAEVHEGAGRVGEPFEFVMNQVEMPAKVTQAGGSACLAEEEATGDQVTVEGYVYKGEVRVYGVIDSECYPGTSSFQRYQYPSSLPEDVTDHLAEISRRVIARLGLDSVTFNIEYFVDSESGRITLLEVNPRHSQSHAKLFEFVDGMPNHECVVRLALGQEPELTHGGGEYAVAGKCFLRHFEDGFVSRVPTADEVARIEADHPGTTIKVVAHEGENLSDLPSQDSYSYELAQVFIGAADQAELNRTYESCVEALPFQIDAPR
ncbi:ATP-grasp domain-containing protein [Nocardiopsis ansamitocini]|uniref:ATP-grasp domain-containing protein n=1 Tax=Nocardiopsis ansamitocini TaxID=1670832 RepID=A0A9W6P6S9_9ACTN|nr:ATP-grasp domain-containing protein [Nocardiopsis ansamitocini]GLU48509.1 hypothetical protein Nans01_28600 [Nocardiopsis ansamitocini]